MWMWLGIASIVLITLGAFGWACVAIGDDPDDDAVAEYEAARAAFEELFE